MPASPRGVLYCGSGDLSGYGQAAIAYVRALVNAGIAVRWVPMDWLPNRMAAGSWTSPDGRPRRLLEQCGTHGHLADVPTLVERTSAPVAYDTVIVHAPPEAWPQVFVPGKRNIGMTVWETDRAPAHWLPLMHEAERVIVPCEFNRTVFARDGLEKPVRVVPHIRRHCWREYAPADIARARAQLGIPPGHRVFYTIGAWDPRKNLPALVRAFSRAFAADAPASLLIKTGATGHGDAPFYPVLPTRDLVLRAMQDAAAETGRQMPHIVLVDAELDGDGIDLVHALGDVYVSLTHGEGWGLGAFEAATFGKPVLMAAWGGQCDFLGSDWPGAIPHTLEPVPLWPPHQPSYFPSQRWAAPDLDKAVALMHAAADAAPAMFAGANAIRERIVRSYAEPVVVDTLLEAIA